MKGTVYALPYLNDGVRLFGIVCWEHLDAEQKKVMNQLIQKQHKSVSTFMGYH